MKNRKVIDLAPITPSIDIHRKEDESSELKDLSKFDQMLKDIKDKQVPHHQQQPSQNKFFEKRFIDRV